MDNIFMLIGELQSDIFAYRIDQFAGKMLSFVESLSVVIAGFSVDEQMALNKVLNPLLISYEKKDYLLVADLLEFELKPLLLAIQSGQHA